MPSLVSSVRALAQVAITSTAFHSTTVLGGSPPSCPNPQISCQNTTAVANTCCFNAPGGQLLQTQFWDFSPATGPSDSWTVHGLWPDHCDGTFDQFCDPNRQYTNITQILQAAGATSLLSYMQTYWKDYQGNDESFWEHEWGKHGTCISTLEPSCYTNYVPQEEVVDFFQATVNLFKTLPSYQWLSNAGILPDSTKTYTSAQIMAALKQPRGVDVVIQCENTNQLDEIWYFFDVQGSTQTGKYIPTNPDGSKGDCPATGIKYLPKTGSVTPPSSTTLTTKTSPSTPTSTSAPSGGFSGKGYLSATTGSQSTGCIISAGTWYTTGTCATFTATASGSGFTLTSSKGKCAVQNPNGVLTCASTVTTATVFTTADDGTLLAVTGENDSTGTWYAGSVPSGSTQVKVGAESGNGATQLQINWTPLSS